jgi:hypothetical protein
VIARTANASGKASLLGVSLDISQGLIIVATPILALLFMLSARMESRILRESRFFILDEISATIAAIDSGPPRLAGAGSAARAFSPRIPPG